MPILAETKIDKSKIYFHGSSEARVDHLEAPSFEHPFYVTSDLHYAMAFCTKSQSSTGDYEVKKTFTPADQNYVYVVTLKPTCQVFDFRDKSSPEFKKLYSIIDKEIVDWVLNSANDLDFDDIYEFIIGLDQELLSKIENYSTYQQYYEASHYTSGKPLETIGKVITQSVFEKAKSFAFSNGIQKASELDIHETMAPILKKLNRLGFQGVLTKEHDYNDEVNWIHITPAKVTTDYAIGIFDKAGLDLLCLVPMRYKWLKKINPDYWYNSTSETASQKIKRFIQLYKKIVQKHEQGLQESKVEMPLQQQVQYWAHMLDEAFPQEKKLAEAHISPSSTKSNPLPPMTKQELQQIEKEFGTTDNFQESGWILPDGKLLQMRRNKERWIQHDFIFPPDSYYARAGISEDDDISQMLLQAGFIRINFSDNPCTVDLRVKPTSAQMDRLYDLIDLDYSSMKDYYYKLKSCLDEFQLEIPGKLIRYEDEDEFKKRFLNDIRNAFD